MFADVVSQVLTVATLTAIVLGTVVGVTIGALPGLSATMAIALLIPATFVMDPVPGLVLLVSVYTAGVYGGSISGILLYAPGTPASAATALDGYPMTQRGEGLKAVVIATLASVTGGLLGGLALILFAPLLGRLSLTFGPPEYFWVGLFGLTVVGGLAGSSMVKGLIAACLGLMISIVGIDTMSGEARLTLGSAQLQAGVQMIPAMIGLFAVAQLLFLIQTDRKHADIDFTTQETSLRKAFPNRGEWKRLSPVVLKSSAIGTGVGILPGAGGDIASWIAYNEAKRSSKNPRLFGKGEPAGIAASESANNAVVGGAMIPTLTLGIPGSAATAVLLGGLIMKGLVPGHELFTVYASQTYSIIAGFMLATVLMAFVGIGLARAVVRIAEAPPALLVSTIMVFGALGSYSIRNSLFDVWVMLAFGLVGYALRTLGIQAAPVILGLILGPIIERAFRQSEVMAGDGSVLALFVTRPLSAALILLVLTVLLFPIIRKCLAHRRSAAR